MIVGDNSAWDAASDVWESDGYWQDSDCVDDTTRLLGDVHDKKNGSDGTEEDVNVESLPILRHKTGGLNEEAEIVPEMTWLRDRLLRPDEDDVNMVIMDDDDKTRFVREEFTSHSSPTFMATCKQFEELPLPFSSHYISELRRQTAATQLPHLVNAAFHQMSSIITPLLRALDSPEAAVLKRFYTPILSRKLHDLQRLTRHPECTPELFFVLTNLVSVIQNSLKNLPSVEESFLPRAEKEDVPTFLRTMESENVAATPHSRSPSFVFDEEDMMTPPSHAPRRRGAISLESPLPEFRRSLYSPEMEDSVLKPKAWRNFGCGTNDLSPTGPGGAKSTLADVFTPFMKQPM